MKARGWTYRLRPGRAAEALDSGRHVGIVAAEAQRGPQFGTSFVPPVQSLVHEAELSVVGRSGAAFFVYFLQDR